MQGLCLNHRAEYRAQGCPTCSQSPDGVLHSLPSNLPIKCPDIWVPLQRMLRKVSQLSTWPGKPSKLGRRQVCDGKARARGAGLLTSLQVLVRGHGALAHVEREQPLHRVAERAEAALVGRRRQGLVPLQLLQDAARERAPRRC